MDLEIMKRLDQITEKLSKLEIKFHQDMESQQNKQNILDQKLSTIITKLEQTNLLQTPITSVVSNLACVQENMEEVVKKVDRMNTTLKDGQDEMKKDMERFNEDVKNTLNNLETTMEAEVSSVKDVVVETKSLVKTCYDNKTLKDSLGSVTQEIKSKCDKLANNFKDYIDETKHEIFAMTEKEAQIVRDRIEGPLKSLGKYTFYFYVLDFKSLVRSEKRVKSLPWYINEIQSCVRGYVKLTAAGGMVVCVGHGRFPLSVGLQPVSGNNRLKLKATICDILKKKLPDLEVGETTWTPDMASIPTHIHQGWGLPLGSVLCDDLLQKGYGDKEGYTSGAVLIRYDVTVL